MSEIMRPVPFPALVHWALEEYVAQGSVFGIRREKFFRNPQQADIPPLIGPAAGPHSQLAQNILAAFLAGARFIELKTVQVMDGGDLRKAVPRPCIYAMDEGYNVEWSTELTVGEAFEEYVKAWFLCHVFAKEFGLDASGLPSLAFNMSVGYNLEGIQSTKIDGFIEGMKDARHSDAWKNCSNYISANIGIFKHFTLDDLARIPAAVSPGITLSTLHGCPREEIEKIASYLLIEKGLHTYIKCNPTLLGYENARRLLDQMGYGYVSFDGHHFKNDLQFDDAVSMLRRLAELAKKRNLTFGVKLTNTFPVQIIRKELPGNEMYMSGRPLFALSINVAGKLSRAFNGSLPISYSGGADYFNIADILSIGIRPVTVATTILKPGGYERFTQLAELAANAFANSTFAHNAGSSGSELSVGLPAIVDVRSSVCVHALDRLIASLPEQKRYRKEHRQASSRKSPYRKALEGMEAVEKKASPLPVFNCFKAPCMDNGCPIQQRIPEYLAALAGGDYETAFKIIAIDNAAPSITGTICDHQCQHNCVRVDYEDALRIRQAKLLAADKAQGAFIAALSAPQNKTEKSAGIIGAGPAGIAAAVFLRRNGVRVTVYEQRDRSFGIVQYVIPSFRIQDEAISRDFQIAQKLGVEFIFNTPVAAISELRSKHDYIVVAIGAWKETPLFTPDTVNPTPRYMDALHFLEDSKKSHCSLDLGKKVAVIGGGDVAMDCARAAKRNRGVETAAIVYRRTREFMPSQFEEQALALADGVEFRELLAPESFADGKLRCEVMRLGDIDASGRRGVEGTGEILELSFDTVIGAIGSQVDTEYFSRNGIALNAKGFPECGVSCESSVPGVYITGDCKSGAATVVRAIADAKAAAADILRKLDLDADFLTEAPRMACNVEKAAELHQRKGIISEAKKDNTDALRCLRCNTLCEICADVCPNRANVAIELSPGNRQIVHIDQMCNECGNCAVFCPHSGPHSGMLYRDKFTIFSCERDFRDSENPGFLKTGGNTYRIRLENKSVLDYCRGDSTVSDMWAAMIQAIENKYRYLLF